MRRMRRKMRRIIRRRMGMRIKIMRRIGRNMRYFDNFDHSFPCEDKLNIKILPLKNDSKVFFLILGYLRQD